MCRSLKPQVEALEEETKVDLKFYAMKSPYDRELLVKLDVSGFPSFLFYKNGQQFSYLSGVNTRLDEIQDQIQMLLEAEK